MYVITSTKVCMHRKKTREESKLFLSKNNLLQILFISQFISKLPSNSKGITDTCRI